MSTHMVLHGIKCRRTPTTGYFRESIVRKTRQSFIPSFLPCITKVFPSSKLDNTCFQVVSSPCYSLDDYSALECYRFERATSGHLRPTSISC